VHEGKKLGRLSICRICTEAPWKKRMCLLSVRNYPIQEEYLRFTSPVALLEGGKKDSIPVGCPCSLCWENIDKV